MITSRQFIKQIPSTEGVIFKLTGTPRAGVNVHLENMDAANNLVYKFEESNDGSTWEEKTFRNSDGEEVTSFTLAAGLAHTVKLNMTTNHIRMKASGTLDALVALSYSTTHSATEATEMYV